MSAKREHEDEDKSGSSSDDECVGPTLSEATETVEKKKRKGTYGSTVIHTHVCCKRFEYK